MTQEDTRVIFSNITELAMFSDQFCDRLEEALGAQVEGGEGEDHVGALFLEIVRLLFLFILHTNKDTDSRDGKPI